MNDWEKKEFILLTEKALDEEDPDRFIEYLMKRDAHTGALLKDNPSLFGNEAPRCLSREQQILERLEEERKKIIVEMDRLSNSKKAVRTYSTKFPLPPMPLFLNKKG
jgi:hypothetical protein